MGLAVGPLVARYRLSDQSYVARFVEQNLAHNRRAAATSSSTNNNTKHSSSSRKAAAAKASSAGGRANAGGHANITFQPLDWELDRPDHSLASDMVIACDCIYNEALIPPFVQTCVDACRLRPSSEVGDNGDDDHRPCVCVVAQQLRDPDIFEAWLREFGAAGFRVWRLPDEDLPPELKSSSGFVVHVGILREAGG